MPFTAKGSKIMANMEKEYGPEKAKRVLGWTPRPVTETVLDTARSLQASGLV